MITIVRLGHLRSPLFRRWIELGPLVKQIIDELRSGPARACWNCGQCTGDKTVFVIEDDYGEDGLLEVTGEPCCERCSQLSDYELWKNYDRLQAPNLSECVHRRGQLKRSPNTHRRSSVGAR
jgi:hypothetical protein